MRHSRAIALTLALFAIGCGPKGDTSSETDDAATSSSPKKAKKKDKAIATTAAASASAAANPQAPPIAPVACAASGDKPTALGDFEGMPRAATVDPARVFWVEQAISTNGVTVRSVNKDGSGAKVLAKLAAKIPYGLAVDATQVYVTADNTLYAIARDGGEPKKLATETFGQIATRGGTVYTFRFDAAAKQDQLIAVTQDGAVTTLASFPRPTEFSKVGALALDGRGGILLVDADGAARIDPVTKGIERLVFTMGGHPRTLFSLSNPPTVRGQQVAFAKVGVGPISGGELVKHEVDKPVVLLEHSVIGISEKYDDIGGSSPATLVQESTSSDKKKALEHMSIFNGTLTGDDACVYVLNSERGKKDQVQAYAVSALQ